jgi:hypothetical protein
MRFGGLNYWYKSGADGDVCRPQNAQSWGWSAYANTMLNYFGVFESFIEPGEKRWSMSDLCADILGAGVGLGFGGTGVLGVNPGRWTNNFSVWLYY